MAHILKLNIWKIKLGTIPWTKNAKNQHLFDKILDTSQKTDPFIAFLDAYIKSFNGKFKENVNGSKSFAPISSEIRTKSNSNLIYGFIEGGITGMVQKVKPNKNSDKAPVCKYRVKIAQVHRLKSEQLSDVKIPFPLICAS